MAEGGPGLSRGRNDTVRQIQPAGPRSRGQAEISTDDNIGTTEISIDDSEFKTVATKKVTVLGRTVMGKMTVTVVFK